jgi:hypothetical protein
MGFAEIRLITFLEPRSVGKIFSLDLLLFSSSSSACHVSIKVCVRRSFFLLLAEERRREMCQRLGRDATVLPTCFPMISQSNRRTD